MKTILIIISFLCISASSNATSDPVEKQRALVNEIIHLAETNICNPTFLETKEWDAFISYIQSEEVLSLEDAQFSKAFNSAARQLTFSHFYLRYTGKDKRNKNKKKVKGATTKKSI